MTKTDRRPLVGVLALQGDFSEHEAKLREAGADTRQIRYASQVADLDGLVIPGGESTAIARLTEEGAAVIFATVKERILEGMPVWGTCMGSIFLAEEIEGSAQGRLGVMSIKVRRNAFGPQKKSFECPLEITSLGEPFPAVFIRAPLITAVGDGVDVLGVLPAELNAGASGIVMARQKNMLVTAFHPELTDDLRVHSYFLQMVAEHVSRPLSSTGV
ncbi:MAG: pyridoxal 5'-phosphate synthase glutaminase subunit PdxT [Candidatus Obscuribacter sp.]|nr:pyridoxal 5'-phosphate synthase glutaminase subunit PdxT [Candidatus Obscuribacter sp.]